MCADGSPGRPGYVVPIRGCSAQVETETRGVVEIGVIDDQDTASGASVAPVGTRGLRNISRIVHSSGTRRK